MSVDFYFIILDMITRSLWKLPKVHLKIYFMGKIEVFLEIERFRKIQGEGEGMRQNIMWNTE